MSRRNRHLSCAAVAALFIAACGIDQQGLAPGAEDDAGGGGSPDGSLVHPDSGGGDASGTSDGPSAHDAADAKTADATPDTSVADATPDTSFADAAPDTSVADACVPAPAEVCTDGIDNDCNGLIDCADPSCATQGFSCVPPIPTGWNLAAVSPASRPACPPIFSGNADLVVDPTGGPATCGCTCSASGVSCVGGTLMATYGNGVCDMGSPDPYPTNGGACTSTNVTILDHVKADVLPATSGSCAAVPTQNIPPPGAAAGRQCDAPGPFGAGCSSGDVCAPKAASPFLACVTQSGNRTCQGGYPTKHVAGTSVNDTRACSACGPCSGPPTATCTNARWNFFQNGNCTGTVGSLVIDGQCDANSAPAIGYLSYNYTATVTGAACTPPAPSTPTGSLTLTGLETICCQ